MEKSKVSVMAIIGGILLIVTGIYQYTLYADNSWYMEEYGGQLWMYVIGFVLMGAGIIIIDAVPSASILGGIGALVGSLLVFPRTLEGFDDFIENVADAIEVAMKFERYGIALAYIAIILIYLGYFSVAVVMLIECIKSSKQSRAQGLVTMVPAILFIVAVILSIVGGTIEGYDFDRIIDDAFIGNIIMAVAFLVYGISRVRKPANNMMMQNPYYQQPYNQGYGAPMGGQQMYGQAPMGGQQMYGQAPIGGQQMMYGQTPMGDQQMYGQAPMGGQPMMNGQAPMGDQPMMYGQSPVEDQPMVSAETVAAEPVAAEPVIELQTETIEEPIVNTEVTEEVSSEIPVQKETGRYCGNCGNKCDADAIFCNACGSRL